MTATKVRDGFEFECDACNDVWHPPALGRGSAPRDFTESFGLAKEAGWRAFKNKNDIYEHRCPDCC